MDPIERAFYREAHSQIRALNDGLIDIESDGDEGGAVHELFRVAHSLKGSCYIQGLDEAGDLAHIVEDVLDAIRRRTIEPTPALIDETLAAVDRIETTIGSAAVGDDSTVDVEAVRSTILSVLEAQPAEEPSSDTEDEQAKIQRPDEGWNPSDDELSDDVVAALEESSEFDDIDALLTELGNEETDDEVEGWGLLDDQDSGDAEQSVDEPTAEEIPDDPSMFFQQAKAAIDEEGAFATLQEDIDAVEFGEFDDDDNYTIEELIELEPMDASADSGADGSPTTEDAASAIPDQTTVGADGPDAADANGEASAAGEPKSNETDDGPESIAADATPATADIDDGASDFVFDLESNDDVTARGLAASDRVDAGEQADRDAPSDVEVAPSEPTVDDEEHAGENEPEPSDPNSDSVEAPYDFPVDVLDSDFDVAAESDFDAAADSDSDASESESALGPKSESIRGSESGSGPTPDSGSDSALATDSPSDADSVPDPDTLPDTDLGVDLSADLGLDGDSDGSEGPKMDVAIDEELAAFESRFDDILGGDESTTEEEGTVFRSAVGTIEESRLDADEFAPTTGVEDPAGPGEFDRLQAMTVDVDTADRLLNVAEELSLTQLRLDEAVGPETDDAIRTEVTNLLSILTKYRRTVMTVRLMPLQTAIETLPRTIRDIARSANKAVELVVDDTDIELDRGIVGRLRDPLAHIARNAVDHGIEPTAEREEAGKPPEGTIEIQTERVGDEVLIEVSDDGRGIDPEAIRQRAVEQGLITNADAAGLSDADTYDLLFEPGFTTTDEVTGVSGRGVGMDAVNRAILDLNGTVEIESEPGYGTTIRLTVPVSIALTEILFVEVAGETFGLPMAIVEQITAVPPVETVDGRDVVRRSDLHLVGGLPEDVEADEAYPLVHLRSALDLPHAAGHSESAGRIVWIHTHSERLAIRCDRVVTSQEVVVRPYGDLLRKVPGVSGATTLGDGKAVNVLEVGSI